MHKSILLQTLSEAGEHKAIPIILGVLAAQWKCPELRPGDDASCLSAEYSNLLLKIDGYSIKSSMLPWMSLYDVGWKAVTAVASDLIAKGGKPLAFTVSIGLRGSRKISELLALILGVANSARTHGAWLLGGDTNSSQADEWIDVAGVAHANRVIPCKPREDDIVVVTRGRIGYGGVVLDVIRRGVKLDSNKYSIIIKETKNPIARLEFLDIVDKLANCITASTDVSDGLSYSLYTLSLKANRIINLEEVPVEPCVVNYAIENNLDPIQLALYGGEEYEIVFTVSKTCLKDLEEFINKGVVAVIGKVTTTRGVGVKYRDNPIQLRRWDQFKGLSTIDQNT